MGKLEGVAESFIGHKDNTAPPSHHIIIAQVAVDIQEWCIHRSLLSVHLIYICQSPDTCTIVAPKVADIRVATGYGGYKMWVVGDFSVTSVHGLVERCR